MLPQFTLWVECLGVSAKCHVLIGVMAVEEALKEDETPWQLEARPSISQKPHKAGRGWEVGCGSERVNRAKNDTRSG